MGMGKHKHSKTQYTENQKSKIKSSSMPHCFQLSLELPNSYCPGRAGPGTSYTMR
jgi:hypothetical protein